MGEVSTFDLASAVGSVRGKCADAVGRRDRSGRVVPATSSKRPDQGPREKHGAWMLARLCGNVQSVSVFTCTADNRIRELQHLTLIHDRTNLSFGRSRRPGLFDRAPPISSLSFGQDIQYSDGGKKFWDTQCMCDVHCVALRISLQSPSAVHFRAVTNIDCQDDAPGSTSREQECKNSRN